MLPRRANDPELPSAWRGVPSPRFVAWARWQALAQTLGGPAVQASGNLIPMAEILTSPLGEAGQLEMSLLTGSAEKAQLDDLQRFVLERLSRHERLILMLFYADGLSLTEIAEVLDLPEATVAEIFENTIEVLRAHFG